MSILARLPTGKGWEGAVGRRLLKLSFEQGAIATFLSGSRGAREGTPGGGAGGESAALVSGSGPREGSGEL